MHLAPPVATVVAALVLTGGACLEAQVVPRTGGRLVRPEAPPPPPTEITWTADGSWRGPTGFPGEAQQSWMAESDYGLTSMNWRERGDDPVWFEFVGRKVCADTACPQAAPHRFSLRNGNLTSQKSVVTGDEHYATSLAVCTSGSGKIKGVRLWYARVRANRTLERASSPGGFQRTNCSNWHSPEQCGARQVIVGIRAHYTDQKGYTGLSIRCGRIT